jgi:formate dehydrogenase alpha subunit
MKAIIDNSAENTAFISSRTAGMDRLKASLSGQQLSDLAASAGVSEASLNEAAGYLKGKKNVMILFGADVIRGASTADAVNTIADLALLLGSPGAENGGILAIEQKNNIQGMLDMGVTPNFLPGYHHLEKPGRDLWQIIDAIEQGSVKGLYIIGADPLVSFPENGRIKAALAKLDLLIVQDIASSELTDMAHVVFPGAAAAEKSGTFTTPDNRIQCLNRAVTPPGEAREDWDIIAELYSRLTGQPHARTVADVTAEIKESVPFYTGSCQIDDGRCSGLVKQLDATPDIFNFSGSCAISAGKAADSQFPFILNVGAIGFHNGTMSTRSENNLTVSPEGYFEISAEDAAKSGISNGTAVKVTSALASVIGKAKISEKLQAGLVFAPYHFAALNPCSLINKGSNLTSVIIEKA